MALFADLGDLDQGAAHQEARAHWQGVQRNPLSGDVLGKAARPHVEPLGANLVDLSMASIDT